MPTGPNLRLLAEALNNTPTPVKLFYDSVLRGKQSPVTEKDFSGDELAAMRGLVGATPKGAVHYPDYGDDQPGLAGLATPKGRVATSLGQFTHTSDPYGTTITDKYDFNPTFTQDDPLVQALSALGTGGFSAIHTLGEKLLPPGKGRAVNIRLPKPYEDAQNF